jgi:hypothetical protein
MVKQCYFSFIPTYENYENVECNVSLTQYQASILNWPLNEYHLVNSGRLLLKDCEVEK